MRIHVTTRANLFEERKRQHIERGYRIEEEHPIPVNGLCSFTAVRDLPVQDPLAELVAEALKTAVAEVIGEVLGVAQTLASSSPNTTGFSSVRGTLLGVRRAAERDENADPLTTHRAVLCSHPGARWTASA